MTDRNNNRNDKALGALLGLAVGDALGTTLEFSRPQAALTTGFPAKMTGPLTDIVGGGPFNVARGQATDDTQMATALAASLAEHKGYNPSDVARRYQIWRSNAFDIGGQTSSGIGRIPFTPQGEEYRAGYLAWRSGRNAAGNGSLMRTAPIGVYFADNTEELTRVSVLDSMMTHADPRCLMACAAYNWSVAQAVRSERAATVHHLVLAAEHGLEAALVYIRTAFPDYYTGAELDQAREDLYTDIDASSLPDPHLFGSGTPCLHGAAGFVRTAFRYAYWSLTHATNYREAIIDVVNRGGDADTNGAIVGGLLGAFFGEQGIPGAWRTAVLTALSDRPSSPWWRLFHPRFFLTLVGLQADLPDLSKMEDTVRSWQRPFFTGIEDPASYAATEDGSYATGMSRFSEAGDSFPEDLLGALDARYGAADPSLCDLSDLSASLDARFLLAHELATVRPPKDLDEVEDDGPLFPEFVGK